MVKRNQRKHLRIRRSPEAQEKYNIELVAGYWIDCMYRGAADIFAHPVAAAKMSATDFNNASAALANQLVTQIDYAAN